MNAIFGQKTEQLQRFSEDGKRLPVTVLRVPEISVIQHKTQEKDGYTAVQLGFGEKKQSKATKPLLGHMKKSGATAPLFLREIRIADDGAVPQVGDTLKVAEILEPGDVVWVTGTSKGKGFAGGVKRYGFRGGPRTHGQSDRERAPGSIGQTTTPGRVYKGKRMAGNMGHEQVTIKNVTVVAVNPEENTVMLAGLVPGFVGSYVKVVKMGTKKNYTPLLKNSAEQATADAEAAKEAAASNAVDNSTSEEVTSNVTVEDAQVEETQSPVEDTTETAETIQAASAEEAPVTETVTEVEDVAQEDTASTNSKQDEEKNAEDKKEEAK
jgi:large subunit ribosomal protein L3